VIDEASIGGGPSSQTPRPPAWVADSPLLARAYALAAEAHGSERRATDQALFVDHVLEVATLLHDAGFDEELIAAGLLHDAVERCTLTEKHLRAEMGDGISSLVLALTEDGAIESFAERKEALREQVKAAGARAITIFAADKLSDIRGLRRGIDGFGHSIEARMGTTIDGMAGHYRESVEMIEVSEPDSDFVPALREELESLATVGGGRLSRRGASDRW
jgi:hypothetical protein